MSILKEVDGIMYYLLKDDECKKFLRDNIIVTLADDESFITVASPPFYVEVAQGDMEKTRLIVPVYNIPRDQVKDQIFWAKKEYKQKVHWFDTIWLLKSDLDDNDIKTHFVY